MDSTRAIPFKAILSLIQRVWRLAPNIPLQKRQEELQGVNFAAPCPLFGVAYGWGRNSTLRDFGCPQEERFALQRPDAQ